MPSTITKPKIKPSVKLAPQWKVIILNDNKTTFEFVIYLLLIIFHKNTKDALRLTREVHETGQTIATITHKERAELLQEQAVSLARGRGFPLVTVIEPV